MAHQQQLNFCIKIKNKFSHFFTNVTVLDIGSLDINGNNKHLFANSTYVGVDVLPGKNVDLVSKGGDVDYPNNSVDTIISTEAFEHDQFYEATIQNIVRMLKPEGFFIFTCATTGRPEHGTRRTTPQDAPLLQGLGEWGDYYKNLEESDIRKIIDVDKTFSEYAFETNDGAHDLYFYGIKSLVSDEL